MLKPKVPVEEFEKYGFKRCKGEYGKNGCYYLCISSGSKMIFISKLLVYITDWKSDDPRIHAKPNCKYRDYRCADDILYTLIKDDLIEMCSIWSDKK